MIKAIVATGELSDAGAAQFLADVIIKRRDKVVAYWIGQTNPLDSFAVARTSTGADLVFDNAAIRVGAAPAGTAGSIYRARWTALDNAAGTERAAGEEIDLGGTRVTIPDSAWGPADGAGVRYATVSINTIDARHPHWANPVQVTVRDRSGALDVVGIERPANK
jgi:hypothetical protein